MIHLYALARREPVVPATGVDDAPVEVVACGELYAVVSVHERRVRADRRAALAHAEVVEAVAAGADGLPVRFGTVHLDEASLRDAVARDVDALSRRLSYVAGRVEVLLRSARPTADDSAAAPTPTPEPVGATEAVGAAAVGQAGGAGRAYLQRRMSEERAEREGRDRAAQRLRAATGGLDAHAVDVVETTTDRGPERCLLIDREDVPAVLAEAARLASEHDLVVGGPWAPYTFAAGAGP